MKRQTGNLKPILVAETSGFKKIKHFISKYLEHVRDKWGQEEKTGKHFTTFCGSWCFDELYEIAYYIIKTYIEP